MRKYTYFGIGSSGAYMYMNDKTSIDFRRFYSKVSL